MVKVGNAINRLQIMLAGLAAAALIGCASAPPAAGSAAAQAAPVRDASALTGLRAENTPAPRLLVETNGKPAYTAYHPQPDVYVVDLLKTVKQPGVVVPTNLPPFVASVSADEVLELGKPLTRVTVRFTSPVAASASPAGNGVEIGFGDVPPAAVAEASFEEAPVEVEVVPAATEEPAPVVAMNLDEEPFEEAPVMAPAPAVPAPLPAHAATKIEAIATRGRGEALEIELAGDGRVDYKDFRLTNPLRAVFDLPGVNRVRRSTVEMDDPLVRRIRISQFKAQPEPVTRVVLDLDELADYEVVREGTRLLIRFGDAPAAPVQTATVQPAAPPVPARAAPVETVAYADIPVVAPTRTETAVIRGPQTDPQTSPSLRESPNVEQPAPPRTSPSEDVFRDDTGPEVAGGAIQPGSSRTLSPGDKVYTGDPIDLELTNADIKDVLRTFAQLTGLNIAIDPNVQGNVTVSFDDVPWDQALELILRQNGLEYTIDGNVMRVGTIERLAREQQQRRALQQEESLNVPLTTVIKRLSYARAAEVSTLVTSLASPRGKIIIDSRTNQLIITDVPQYLPTMLNLIENVDIPTPQVVIEARIVETTKTFSRQLGVSWGFNGSLDPAIGSGTGLVWPNRVGLVGGPFNFTQGNPVLTLSLDSVLGTFDLDLTLTAAENEGLVRIISSPKVTTQDNQSAEIQSGLQIPFQTRVNFTTTVSFIDATLRLTVTPQITADDTVIMDVNVQKVEPLSGLDVAGATNPPLQTRRAQTRLMVRDGGTTVIGGIYQATDQNAQNRLPFVHEIPVVGNLFKSRRIENRNDELLIFITPRIVRNI